MKLLAILLLAQPLTGVDAAMAAAEGADLAAQTAPEADCIGQPSQTDMNLCSFQDFQAANAVLNALWDDVVAKAKAADQWSASHDFPIGELDRLERAQQAWLEFRDADCLYQAGPQDSGGTIWPLVLNACRKTLTEARIAQLRAMLEPHD